MKQDLDIVCIGAVLWDTIGRASVPMRLGSDVPGRITRVPGGVALNIAMALQSYGVQPALLSYVGADAEGDQLSQACTDLGLITAHLTREGPWPTDHYMAIEGTNGVTAAIADAHSLEQAGDTILAPMLTGALADWTGLVALDGNLTETLLQKISTLPRFHQADLRVAPASPGKALRLQPFLDHTSATIYVNREEAEVLMQRAFETSQEAAVALTAGQLKAAVVTDGPARATVARQGQPLVSLPPPSVEVVRLTGAGDTFMAAHIAADQKGVSADAALQSALEATARYISGDQY